MRLRLLSTIATAAGIWSPVPAQAQSSASVEAQAGFTALLLTPVGALPQVMFARRTLDSSSRVAVALRYGRYNFSNGPGTFNNLGLTGMLKLASRLTAAATIGQRTCQTCEGLKMAGIDLTASLLHKEASGDIGATPTSVSR